MNAIPNELRDLLANLVLQHRRPDPSWVLGPDDRERLVRWIEQALIEPEFHRQYLNHVRTLLGETLPDESAVNEEKEQRQAEEERLAVNSGLRGFPADRLVHLAIDPVALMCLRAAIFDPEVLPEYWWQHAKEFANERRPLKTAAEILQTLGLTPSAPSSRPTGRPKRVLTPLSALSGDAPSAAPPSEKPERWPINVPMADLQWIDSSPPPVPAEMKEQFLRLDLTFWRHETPSRLEIQFGGIASLTGEVSCTARLILAQATNENRRLTFTGLSERDLAGAILEGEYRKEGAYHFRFRVELSAGKS